jgi:hypothetical protein
MVSSYRSAAYTAIIAAFDDAHGRAMLFTDRISRAVACDRAVRNYHRARRRFAETVPISETEAADMLETLLGLDEEVAVLHDIAPMIEQTVSDLRSGRCIPTIAVRLRGLHDAATLTAGSDSDEAVLVRSVLRGMSRQRPTNSSPLGGGESDSHALPSPEDAVALKRG